MKRTLLSTLVITSTLGLSTNVLALSMGELELKSTLNQPLQAEIELTNIDDLTEWEIKPSLASDGDFDRAGVEKVFFLSDIDFEIKGSRIVLTSDKSVTEPFLNFLVQVNWPSGRVLREYTLLLDPPVFDDQIQPLTAQNAPQRSNVQAAAVVKAQPKNQGRWESEEAAEGTYKVQRDDTLWEIAIKTRPSRKVSPQQMMLAIQDSNPAAFINGNINRLKTHQVLRIPNQQQMAARNDSQAVNEVSRQNRELQTAGAQIDATANAAQTNKAEQSANGGELKLVANSSKVAESAGASGDIESGAAGNGPQNATPDELVIALESLDTSKLENNDLKERLASLEDQIATLQRLVSLKDDQLASIQALELQKEAQAEVIQPQSEQLVTEEIVADETEVSSLNSSVVNNEVDVALEAEDFNYADTETVTETVVTEEIDPALAAAQMQQQAEDRYKPKGLFAEIMAKPALVGGIAGGFALLLALIGLGIKKRRDQKEGEVNDPALAGFDENFEFPNENLDDASLEGFELDDDDQLVTDSNELNDDLLEGISGSGEEGVDADLDSVDSETVAQTADIIGEAEIYIAYGRFDQAADLLKNSIELEPSRIDLRTKLLEVYLETDDATSFAEAELDLNSLGDIEANEKAVAMRSRLTSPITGDIESLDAEELSFEESEIDLSSLADADDEFSDGIDFEAALDLTDIEESNDDFVAALNESEGSSSDLADNDLISFETDSVADEEFDIDFSFGDEDTIPAVDESADKNDVSDELSLEEVPTLDVDIDSIDNLDGLESLESLEGLDDLEGLDTLEDLDGLDELENFDGLDGLGDLDNLGSLDDSESLDVLDESEPLLDTEGFEDLNDIPTLESNDSELDDSEFNNIPTLEDDPSADFDLTELEGLSVTAEEASESSGDHSIVDLTSMTNTSDSEESDALSTLLDSDDVVDDLPEFDLGTTGFESDSSDEDLESLDAELSDLTIAEPDASETFDSDTSELESELGETSELGFESLADNSFEGSSEFDLNELEDLPDFSAETNDLAEGGFNIENDIENVASPANGQATSSKEIDIDQLAASEDEFDFLAGTDECATKLDLARAYLDMEDSEGAKELLQEVVAEGSDQQKHDARALMDSIG
jgi:pilus assembly protein FimV